MSKKSFLTIFLILFPFFPVYVYFPVTWFGKYLFIDFLSFLFLLPVMLFYKKEFNKNFIFADTLIIAFLILSTFLTWYHTFETGRFLNISVFVHRFFFYFLPYFVFSRYIKKLEELIHYLKLILFGSIIFIIFGIYEYLTKTNIFLNFPFMDLKGVSETVWSTELTRYDDLRVKTAFAHPLSFGVYCSAVYFLAFGFFLNTNEIKKRYIYLLLMVFLYLQLILSQSRGALVITTILTFVVIILNFNFKIIASMVLIVTFFMIFISNLFPNLKFIIDMGSYDMQTFEYRINLWNEFIGNIHNLPLFGSPSAYYLEWLSYGSSADIVSWYLEVIVYYGIITLFIQILFILLILKNLFSIVRKEKIYLTLILPLISFLLNYINVSFVGTAQVYFMIFLGLSTAGIIIFRKNLYNMN